MNNPVTNYAVQWLREYRYESGRARYMARKYHAGRVMANRTNPQAWSTSDSELTHERLVEVFTDYEGDEAYGDFVETDFTSVPPDNTFSYELGQWWKDLVSGAAEYLHNDHLGTLRQSTGSTGALGTHRVYTAFGELVAGPTTPDRFGYVGAHGYQNHDNVPYQHVGARYYDPSSGRFLQRDPIGIVGGRNVYVIYGIDPSGLGPLDWIYTGYWDPPAGVYEAATEAAGEWLYGNSPVRGGYVSAGAGPLEIGGSWSIESGSAIFGGAGFRHPSSGNNFEFGWGYGFSYGEEGPSHSIGGYAKYAKGRKGVHAALTAGCISFGVSIGPISAGVLVDYSKL